MTEGYKARLTMMDPNYSMSCMKNFYGCYQLRIIGKYPRLLVKSSYLK